MARDIANFITACPACQLADVRKPQAHLQPWQTPDGPFRRVHIDLYGPLVTHGAKKHIMVATDAFSKWVEVVAIEDKAAPTVAAALFLMWVCCFGPPAQVVSDGARSLPTKSLTVFSTCFKRTKRQEANDQVKWFTRDMGNYLRRVADWEAFLPALAFEHKCGRQQINGHDTLLHHLWQTSGDAGRPGETIPPVGQPTSRIV